MDRVFWGQHYRNSSLLRPPGPFPYQSSRDLAVALLKSEKLDATWSSATSDSEIRCPPPVQKRVLSEGVDLMSRVCLLLGRWLLVGGNLGAQAYDLDAGSSWQLPVGQISRTRRTNQMAAAVYTNDDGMQSAFVAIYSGSLRVVCVSPPISKRLSAYPLFSDKYIERYSPNQAFSNRYHFSTSLRNILQWLWMAIHWMCKATSWC